ncbi:MAG: T9SS type A sorting domain-containing protein [Bacteroidia bacterium]|nr:T9SS type A sorting domain-containing protein [Bacteroidia bacterium]
MVKISFSVVTVSERYVVYTLTSVLGVSDVTDREVVVFPNPVSSYFTIKVKGSYIGENYYVFNCLGQQVINGKIVLLEEKINVEALVPGLYFLQLGSGQSYKLVKE